MTPSPVLFVVVFVVVTASPYGVDGGSLNSSDAVTSASDKPAPGYSSSDSETETAPGLDDSRRGGRGRGRCRGRVSSCC